MMKQEAKPAHPLPETIDYAAIRSRLKEEEGRLYWRSLEDLLLSPDARRELAREFPPGASEWPAQLDRRSFLGLMAASLALAGVTGCTRQPLENILPYVRQPEELVLGEPLFFATAMPLSGFGAGMLVKSREGRPIKADGNPDHPASLGGSSIWLQTCLLDLYDPDRARAVTKQGQPASWAAFQGALHQALLAQQKKKGAGLRILTQTITSPTLGAQLSSIQKAFPQSRWHQYEPVNRDYAMEGAQMAFGERLAAHYDFRAARRILSIDSDFLYTHPERLRYARHFSDQRRVVVRGPEMNRLYVVEPSLTVTGANADHRLALSSRQLEAAAFHLARELGLEVEVPPGLSREQQAWMSAVARDLKSHLGESLVTVGEFQPPHLHALEHFINRALENAGRTVRYTPLAEAAPVMQIQSLQDLVRDMEQGKVELLFIVGGNPAYDAPSDLAFANALQKVEQAFHLTVSPNETSVLCEWLLPRSHFLESWGDIRSFDGTVTIMQPLIAPLFDSRSDYELLGLIEQPLRERKGYEIVRAFWRETNHWKDFETGWRRALHDGLVENTSLPAREPAPRQPLPRPPSRSAAGLEAVFRPDPNVWDGRFADNPWLQETPKPISKLTWDNAILISPGLAERMGLSNQDMVEVRAGPRKVKGPILVYPGQADDVITLHLGYGRTRAGRPGRNVGFNFYPLRTSATPWSAEGVTLDRVSGQHTLVTTQTHQRLESEERQIFRAGTLEEFRQNPDFVQKHVKIPGREETLYDPRQFEYFRKWGMCIDLTTCIGCNACLTACNIENNIPVVGKEQVRMSREMLWLRVDTYFKGTLDNPQVCFEPVPCMHCENAPCEYVCPVEAAIHDSEGLNLQVYNRCVGTRYCSNNCPYKVRRFNFLSYANLDALGALRQNPEVSVRWRGVMEKCTYCVQRISAARVLAKEENRDIREGEVQTACQQACPTAAIVFGIMTDSGSEVSRYKQHPLDFPMLGQLNTRPRTTYLAKLTNPNQDLKEPQLGQGGAQTELKA